MFINLIGAYMTSPLETLKSVFGSVVGDESRSYKGEGKGKGEGRRMDTTCNYVG